MNFDLVDFRLLLAIVQTGSLSKAAVTLPIALSAASSRLRRFEQQCGVEVFTRGADGMTPTPAGRLILDRIRRIVGEAEQLQETVRDLTGRRRISLRLAGTTVATTSFLPAAIGPFLADYPEVDLQMFERNDADVLNAVQSGEVEIGVFDPSVAPHSVLTMPFRKHRLILLVPAEHPLATLPEVRFKDALDYPFVCLPPERPMQHFLEDVALRNARSIKVRVRAPSFNAMIELVAEKAGIALLPEIAWNPGTHDMKVSQVPIADGWAARELRICVQDPDALSVHAQQLLAYLAPDPASTQYRKLQ